MLEYPDTYAKLSALPAPHMAKEKFTTRFGLIVPPSPFVVPVGWEWTHTAPFEGPSVIASVVKGLGYPFQLLDQREDFDTEHLRGKLKQFKYIGIACYEDSFPYQKNAIEICKQENPDCIVIMGGPLVTSVPELLMNNTLADYAVIGEGELTLIELMDYLSGNADRKAIDKIHGLAWKNERGEVIKNQARKQMKNLDVVPFQDFSVWERFNGKDIPEIYLSTTRGCPCTCSFCFRAMPKYHEKSVERVKAEIGYYKQRNFKHSWINDLTFNTNIERTHRLMNDAFSTYTFSWNSFNRVTNVDAPTLKLMKQRGCDIILYGFEAISQDILNTYRKGISKSDMINAIMLTRESGIKVGGLFIIGAPEETHESLQNIISFCKEFKEITRVKYLSALPGTPLYYECLKKGLIKSELDHLDFLSREQSIEEDIDEPGFLYMAANVEREELRASYHQINERIEVRPYQYWQQQNVFLDEPQKFEKRIK